MEGKEKGLPKVLSAKQRAFDRSIKRVPMVSSSTVFWQSHIDNCLVVATFKYLFVIRKKAMSVSVFRYYNTVFDFEEIMTEPIDSHKEGAIIASKYFNELRAKAEGSK